MRKFPRILSSGALAVGVIFGGTAVADHLATNEAQAAEMEQVTEPWYDYSGYTGLAGSEGSFFLEQDFINAVADQNFTINGYEIDGSQEAMEEHGTDHHQVEIYDQQILKYAEGKALGVSFPIQKGEVSTQELFEVYGETENTAPSDPDETAYYYYQIEDQNLQFITHDGWVTEVRYGGDLMSHS